MREKEFLENALPMIDDAPACARSEDLVAYLYGEADQSAAQAFEAHARACACCRAELYEFGQLRASIGEWRQQALGSLSSAVTTTTAPVAVEPISLAPERKRSALAAIRAFFSLSPVWMRAATVAMAVVFCALIALVVAHYDERPKIVAVERAAQVKPTVTEFAKMSKETSEQKRLAATAPEKSSDSLIKTETASFKDKATPAANRILKDNAARQQNLAGNRVPKLNLSPQESREIARDLRLVASQKEDDDLPRLSDLLDETN